MLEIERVVKEFDGLRVLNGATLKVERGEIAGLIGPNGSGKTTLFNVVSGVYKPDGGAIKYKGERIDGLKPYQIFRRGLVRTFQIPRLFQKLSVLNNMLIAAKKNSGESFSLAFLKGKWLQEERGLVEKARDILKFLDLDRLKDEPASNLSGGQMKLLELGRALMSDPEMLLIDEPASGVNPALVDKIFRKLLELREEGLTFLIIEHRMEALLSYADKIHVMYKGEVIAEGTPSEIVNNPQVINVYLGEA
ncbi:ABC transporter ATP-binding protein [Candidatus Bathyarchaeota archaeon]|nr:MAG: ABC transporter ATP-binding protein [Candidatus Hecatellales archaeon]RLI35856.1 MAG: ABC transporter ATP-binding protein [Candidatus Bathyarchaeota archaeon]